MKDSKRLKQLPIEDEIDLGPIPGTGEHPEVINRLIRDLVPQLSKFPNFANLTCRYIFSNDKNATSEQTFDFYKKQLEAFFFKFGEGQEEDLEFFMSTLEGMKIIAEHFQLTNSDQLDHFVEIQERSFRIKMDRLREIALPGQQEYKTN